MVGILYTIDSFFFVLALLAVLYLLVFALLAQRRKPEPYPSAKKQHRVLVLFPAYKEDRVIVESVRAFLGRTIPGVIPGSGNLRWNEAGDRCAIETAPVEVINARSENSSKAAALNLAIEKQGKREYDIVAIMDADNIAAPDFLQEINDAYDFGVHAIQAHRTSKGGTTDVAVLDAVRARDQ